MAEIRHVLGLMAAVAASATLPVIANSAVTNVTGQVVLAADADWRGCGLVSMAEGASIDLAGHTLKVDGVAQTAVQLVDATSSAGAVSSTAVYSGAAEFLFSPRRTGSRGLRPSLRRILRPAGWRSFFLPTC